MVFDKIADIIADKLDIERDLIKPESSFDDMEVDSLYMVEIMLSIEEEFNITIEDASEMKTVADLCDYAVSYTHLDVYKRQGLRDEAGILASITSIIISTKAKSDSILRFVLAIWPGYHWIISCLLYTSRCV